MYLRGKYVTGSAVEYRVEARLTDCAIRRSLSFLSPFLTFLWLVIRVLAAVHVEVVVIATKRSASVERFFTFFFMSRSLLVRWLVEYISYRSFELNIIDGRLKSIFG
jgi:hypothetical protein